MSKLGQTPTQPRASGGIRHFRFDYDVSRKLRPSTAVLTLDQALGTGAARMYRGGIKVYAGSVASVARTRNGIGEDIGEDLGIRGTRMHDAAISLSATNSAAPRVSQAFRRENINSASSPMPEPNNSSFSRLGSLFDSSQHSFSELALDVTSASYIRKAHFYRTGCSQSPLHRPLSIRELRGNLFLLRDRSSLTDYSPKRDDRT